MKDFVESFMLKEVCTSNNNGGIALLLLPPFRKNSVHFIFLKN